MQRKTADKLIDETSHLVGQTIWLEVLNRDTHCFETRQFRMIRNDQIINLKSPEHSRVCLDVYAELRDMDGDEVIYVSLDKLKKQRLSE